MPRWLIAAVAVVAAAVYFVFDPSGSHWFPKCPVFMLTGLECPGCGSQRALHCLLHLDIAGAFRHNALMVAALPYLAAVAAVGSVAAPGPRVLRWRRALTGRVAVPALVVIIVWGVVRNLI